MVLKLDSGPLVTHVLEPDLGSPIGIGFGTKETDYEFVYKIWIGTVI